MIDKRESLGEALFVLFIALPLLAIWSGYAVSCVWEWFMVPAFGLPVLSVPMCIGIRLTTLAVIRTHRPVEEEANNTQITFGFGYYLMVIIIGWLVKQFV